MTSSVHTTNDATFRHFCTLTLNPLLRHVESLRLGLITSMHRTLGVSIALVILAGGALLVSPLSNFYILAGIAASAIILAAWFRHRLKRIQQHYRNEYKRAVFPPLIKHLGLSSFDPDGEIAATVIGRSRLFTQLKKWRSEDLLTGTLNNSRVEACEVRLRQRHDATSQRLLLMVLYLGGKVKGTTIIHHTSIAVDDRDMASIPVNVEGMIVHTDTPSQASTIIHADIEKQIMQLMQSQLIQRMAISFFDNKAVVAMWRNYNVLEPPPLFHPADDERLLHQYRDDIEQLESLMIVLQKTMPSLEQQLKRA